MHTQMCVPTREIISINTTKSPTNGQLTLSITTENWTPYTNQNKPHSAHNLTPNRNKTSTHQIMATSRALIYSIGHAFCISSPHAIPRPLSPIKTEIFTGQIRHVRMYSHTYAHIRTHTRENTLAHVYAATKHSWFIRMPRWSN